MSDRHGEEYRGLQGVVDEIRGRGVWIAGTGGNCHAYCAARDGFEILITDDEDCSTCPRPGEPYLVGLYYSDPDVYSGEPLAQSCGESFPGSEHAGRLAVAIAALDWGSS